MKRHLGIAAVALCAMCAVSIAAPFAGAATGTKKLEACNLLTRADIEPALGVTAVVPASQGPPSTTQQCHYQWEVVTQTGSGQSFATGTLSVGYSKYDKFVKRDLPKNSKAPGASKIPGVKKGYVNPDSGGAGAIIEAVKGKTFFTIQVFFDGVTKKELVKLMKLVLKRA